ncbi:MAG: hypothetical protein AAGD38_10495 [Acidobacteriota bacterium]
MSLWLLVVALCVGVASFVVAQEPTDDKPADDAQPIVERARLATDEAPEAEPETPPVQAAPVATEVATDDKVVTARMKGPPGNRRVRIVRQLIEDAGRVDWHRNGNLVFDRKVDGVYEIHQASATGDGDICLTCDNRELRGAHKTSPSWYGNGSYVVFQVQPARAARRLKQDAGMMATPYRGLHAEVWAYGKADRDTWQLAEPLSGALNEPHLSAEPGRIVWSERETNRGRSTFGGWALVVADLEFRRGIARLRDSEFYRPAAEDRYLMTHGFTPDERGVLFSGVPADEVYGETGLDLMVFDIESETVDVLTRTPRERDGAAHYTADGESLIWATNRGLEGRPNGLPYRSDLWIMPANGKGIAERLTFFNDPASDHYLDEALIDDFVLSPEGDALAAHVLSRPLGGEATEAIWLVQFRRTSGDP